MARDSNGLVLSGFSSSRHFYSSPLLTECWALWHSLIFCDELGQSKVQLEREDKVVIQEVKKIGHCGAWYGESIEDVKATLKLKSN